MTATTTTPGTELADVLHENAVRTAALLSAARSYSPSAREIADRLTLHVRAVAGCVRELESVVEQDKLLDEIAEVEGQETALGSRKRELLARLRELNPPAPEPDKPAPAGTAPSPAEPAGSRAATAAPDPELWERAILHHTHDARVRLWLKDREDIGGQVKAKGPLKREHVELYLSEHPQALDAIPAP